MLFRSTAAPAAVAAPASGAEVAPQLLALLSGRQLAAAAALAAASGNVRLATLLAQAGTKSLGQAEVAAQLQVGRPPPCAWLVVAWLGPAF